MSTIQKPTRDIGLDITRILAFCNVVCVHFFLNSGFYSTTMVGKRMYLMAIMRTMFMTCVPLFMLLTGYLSSPKQVDLSGGLRHYYGRLTPILLTYALSTLAILAYQVVYRHAELSLKDVAVNLLGFQQYSWYISMYIGCLLLIPFLNTLWRAIASHKGQLMLVLVLAVMTMLPSVLNAHDLQTPGALWQPWLTKQHTKLVPDWWQRLYPLTYYFIGAYLRERVDIKRLPTGRLAVALGLSLLACGAFNAWKSYSRTFVWGSWCDWGGVQNVTNAVLLFLLINSIRYPQLGERTQRAVAFVSKLTLAAYLLSWIPDNYVYEKLNAAVSAMPQRLNAFWVVFLNIAVSLVMAAVVQGGVTLLTRAGRALRSRRAAA